MSEYIARCAGSHPAKLHWSYQKEASGKTTLMLKHTGSAEEVYSLASAFVVGGSYTFTANCQCPVSGTFYGERMIAQQTDVGIYEVQRYYSRGGDGGSAGTCAFDCTDYDELSYQAQTLGVAERIAEKTGLRLDIVEAYIGAMPLGAECACNIAMSFGSDWVDVGYICRGHIISAMRAGSYWVYMPVLSRVQKQTSRFSGVGGNIGKRQDPQMRSLSVPSGYKWLLAGDSVSYDGVYWVRRREWLGALCWSPLLYDCAGSSSGT